MIKVLLFAPMASVHEKFNVACISALLDLNVEIHLAANFSIDSRYVAYAESMKKAGIIIHDLPLVRSSFVKNIQNIKQLKKILGKEKFDIVHAHTETGGLVVRLAMSISPQTKYIYTPHGMSFWKGGPIINKVLFKPIEYWICRSMSANIAINKEEFSVLKSWGVSQPYFIHGTGVDITMFQSAKVNKEKKKESLGIVGNPKVLLSVGELNSNKNHKIILDALAKIGEACKDLSYVVCGADRNNGALKNYLDGIKLKNQVVLTGFRSDMSEIYPIADIFAFPSYHEGLPVSVMEAMANGMPVVASKIRGVSDLIDDGVGGFLYKPNDSHGFAEGIMKLYNDIELCCKMGEINKKNVCMFDVSQVKKEMFNIYSNVIRQIL